MEILKNFRVVISVVFVVLILIFIRYSGVNHFKNDAKRWAEPTLSRANIITPEQVRSLPGDKLTINLDKKMMPGNEITGDLINISADSILNANTAKLILRHKGPVLVYSSQTDLSAKIWMILSQMGCKKIYILTERVDDEILKYKFQPDTLSSNKL
jgi:hypothetical protein